MRKNTTRLIRVKDKYSSRLKYLTMDTKRGMQRLLQQQHEHAQRRMTDRPLVLRRVVAIGIIVVLLALPLLSIRIHEITYAAFPPSHNNSTHTHASSSVLWETTVPGFVNDLHLFSPSNASPPTLIVTSEKQITGINLTTGATLWNTSAESYLQSLYPQLIDWWYEWRGISYIDSDQDTIPELWVVTSLAENITGLNIPAIPDNISVHYYLFAYDLLSHTLTRQLLVANNSLFAPRVGHFGNCTNDKGLLLSWINFERINTTWWDYVSYLGVVDAQTLEVAWETPPLTDDWLYGLCWAYDLTGDGYDEVISSWGYWGVSLNAYITVYDGRTFTQLWNVSLPFLAQDADFVDVNNDDIPDILFTGYLRTGVCAVDGETGHIIWTQTERYCTEQSVILDIDHDGELEVISSFLDNVGILNAYTGELEVAKTLPFAFDATDLKVADLDKDGEYEIVASSFYGGVYVFNRTFDLLKSFATGIGGPLLLTDITGDGTLEIIAGMSLDTSPVIAFVYASVTNDGSQNNYWSFPTSLFIVLGGAFVLTLLAVPVLLLHQNKKTRRRMASSSTRKN